MGCYEAHCKNGNLKPGTIFESFTDSTADESFDESFDHMIIFAATKDHWRNPSKLEWVVSCLQSIAERIVETNTPSIAIPALGCGLGGLSWTVVQPLMTKYLGALPDVDTTVTVFEPW